MAGLNKKIRKELRDLSRKAYQRQLDHELSILVSSIDDWRDNKINCFELSDKIHQFHDGPARDLWKRYNYGKNHLYMVAAAIAEGYIKQSEISEEALRELRSIIQSYLQDAME